MAPASRPRTDSVIRCYLIRLLPQVADAEAHIRIRMQDARAQPQNDGVGQVVVRVISPCSQYLHWPVSYEISRKLFGALFLAPRPSTPRLDVCKRAPYTGTVGADPTLSADMLSLLTSRFRSTGSRRWLRAARTLR